MESFLEIAKGTLDGILFEKQYDTLLASLQGSDEWYAAEFNHEHMQFTKLAEHEVKEKLVALRNEVKNRNKHNTFPFTYFKNNPTPIFIKLYDPARCGSSCSLTKPDPWWIFTKILPDEKELKEAFPPPAKKRYSFFS